MEKIVRINKDGYLDVFSTDIKEFNSLFENDGCFVLDIPIMEDGNVFKYYSLDGTPDLVKEEAEQLEQAKASMESAIQSHIDSQAQSLGYDGIVSACSYAGYTNEFQAEAIALGVWRSVVWTKAYQVQADVEAGIMPMPTEEELIAMLPKYGV